MAYSANGVEFDGTNDYLTRDADLSGNVNGKKGIISLWLRMNGGNSSRQVIMAGSNGRILVSREADNVVKFRGINTSGTVILDIRTNNTYLSGGGFNHFLASWDLSVEDSGSIYVDDVKDYNEIAFINDTIDYTRVDHAVGAGVTGGQKLDGCLADVYLNYTTFLDLDVVANRRKFITASKTVVDLGADGSTPTGTAPIAFFSGGTTGWETNLGSGGGYTENGALTDCATDPPAAAAPAGTGVQTLPSLNQAGVGVMQPAGTGAQTLAALVQAGVGAEEFTATGALVLPALAQAGSGVQAIPGTGIQTLAALTQAGAGAETFAGSGANLLAAMTQSGIGRAEAEGAGAQTLAAIIQSASGVQIFVGTGAQVLGALTQAGVGVMLPSGAAAQTLASLLQAGAGVEIFTATGAHTLASILQAGVGIMLPVGAGAQILPALIQASVLIISDAVILTAITVSGRQAAAAATGIQPASAVTGRQAAPAAIGQEHGSAIVGRQPGRTLIGRV